MLTGYYNNSMEPSHEPILGELGFYTPLFWLVVAIIIWNI